MIESFRKIFISLFFLIHTSAVIVWVFSPYTEMVLANTRASDILRSGERLVFSRLEQISSLPFSKALNSYVDLIGAHQYWDFFAPETPTVHRYIRVCEEISANPLNDWIECINPLYQSFDGTLSDAARAFNGRRSRSFRLAETLLRMNRADFFESFTRYWLTNNRQGKNLSHAYLLESAISVQFNMAPGAQYSRQDKVVWIATE